MKSKILATTLDEVLRNKSANYVACDNRCAIYILPGRWCINT